MMSNGLSNSLTVLLPLAFAILVGSGREAFSASSVAQYTVSFGSGEFSYAMMRPTKFLTAPRSSVKLSKNSSEEFVAAFYERSTLPDMPLYRVGGTLVRTTADALPSDEFELNKLLNVYRSEAILRVGVKDTRFQTHSVAKVDGKAWMLLRTYVDSKKRILKSVVYTRPVTSDIVVIFSLNFWESNKNAEWRESRVPILFDIVRSIEIHPR